MVSWELAYFEVHVVSPFSSRRDLWELNPEWRFQNPPMSCEIELTILLPLYILTLIPSTVNNDSGAI